MLPENHACNARNKYPGRVYVKTEHDENFYCDDVEVDYKSDDLTYEAILNLFRGRYSPNFPESKKLKTNSDSKVFIYMNGHGGENFFKIQDTEVLQSEDFAKVYQEMHMKRMYKEILMFIDTCQAMSLFDQVEAPNLFLMGTSKTGQSAYSHQHDNELNLELNDKFTFAFYQFLAGEYLKYTKKTKLGDFPDLFPFSKLDSHIQIKYTHPTKTPADLYLYEYIPLPDTRIDGTTLYNLDDYDEANIL